MGGGGCERMRDGGMWGDGLMDGWLGGRIGGSVVVRGRMDVCGWLVR